MTQYTKELLNQEKKAKEQELIATLKQLSNEFLSSVFLIEISDIFEDNNLISYLSYDLTRWSQILFNFSLDIRKYYKQ